MDELKGLSFFYYAFSELFLEKDYYYLNSLCNDLINSTYSNYALKVLRHMDSFKLQEELELMDDVSLLERDYRDVDPKLISSAYKHSGFKIG